jgi:dipeptidyl aminopeptidase/acylaminoacyl peptidase
MRRTLRLAIAVVAGIAIGSILVTHNALVIRERSSPEPLLAQELARATGSTDEIARVTAADGALLDGWVFTPRDANGGGVILLHGVGDTRRGMLQHARFLLRAGYTVLTPDARSHGASGGKYITYGVLESRDVRTWAEWLISSRRVERLYGLGESMGASVLLQSLAVEPRFRAVVAECPFATFEEIAYDRMWQATGAPRALFWPIVTSGFAYARLWHGFNLYSASPLEAVRATSVPVLLIHGDQDHNVEIRHSRLLHAANPKATRLWEVPGADHVNAIGIAPGQYLDEVVRWFR